MNKLKEIYKKIMSFLFDKKDKKAYNEVTRETLIRNMFPGIKLVSDDLDGLKRYISGRSIGEVEELVNILMTFYWSSTGNLLAQKKYDEAIKYEGIIEFCSSIMILYQTIEEEEINT